MSAVTALSSRGQVVLPASIRKRLGLTAGTQFVVISDDENILLKPVREPSFEAFGKQLDKSKKWAKHVGMQENDIREAIAASRKAVAK